jgi:hypothetical protein
MPSQPAIDTRLTPADRQAFIELAITPGVSVNQAHAWLLAHGCKLARSAVHRSMQRIKGAGIFSVRIRLGAHSDAAARRLVNAISKHLAGDELVFSTYLLNIIADRQGKSVPRLSGLDSIRPRKSCQQGSRIGKARELMKRDCNDERVA